MDELFDRPGRRRVGTVLVVVVRMVTGDDTSSRQHAVDQRLRATCGRSPTPAEVRAVIGEKSGSYQDGKGRVWREGDTSRKLVARRTPFPLEEWTKSVDRTDATTRSPIGAEVAGHTSVWCTTAFDDGAGGTVEVKTPTEIDLDRAKTIAAASAITDTVRK